MAGGGTVKPMTPLSHQLQIEKLSKELASKEAELASLRNEHSRQEPRLIALRDANRRLERQVTQVSPALLLQMQAGKCSMLSLGTSDCLSDTAACCQGYSKHSSPYVCCMVGA